MSGSDGSVLQICYNIFMDRKDVRNDRTYAAIDLKSFYASVECRERGLDPLSARLVVADASRTDKTICLAVSPALKDLGIKGRCRLFEVYQRLKELERETGSVIDFLIASPRMQLYIDYSSRVYETYLSYVSPDDIHVYSIDEVFVDLTDYMALYRTTAENLVSRMIRDVYDTTGITATAGIGENLYLAKIAMDIMAKKAKADANGVRMARLDRMSFRRELWEHQPLTDFWRMGRGIAERLSKYGLKTMGDIARMSISHEESLYREFGIDAELLIDHAWGEETCLMEDIKNYRPRVSSISSGQVLPDAYPFEKARLVIHEMADAISLDLVASGLETDGVALMVGYDRVADGYRGRLNGDRYGRSVPPPATGSARIADPLGNRRHTSSTRRIVDATLELFDRIVDPSLPVRRMSITLLDVVEKGKGNDVTQYDLFQDAFEEGKTDDGKEEAMQRTLLCIKRKWGRNAILKAMNLEDGSTAMERNNQIGGHKA